QVPMLLFVLVGVRDIAPEIDRVSGFVFALLAAQVSDGAFEHLRVKIETQRVHVPGLLSAQHVAGASQFQIKSGDAKPRAQLGKLANCCQPSSRNRRKLLLSGNQKISISAAIRPSHAPAQLIKLRKTVSIGAIYDDGVCARDVYAVLDNRGRDER